MHSGVVNGVKASKRMGEACSLPLQGFIVTSKFGTVKPKIPVRQYAVLVVLFFLTSVPNNYVYALHVPSTLHMIIRSDRSMVVYWIAKKASKTHKMLAPSITV
ncbi:UAA transporter family domain-containing protein [Phthorimaea operculella]|nr:UAA transporter family domain-containing protein [Phthorimaea operculella]